MVLLVPDTIATLTPTGEATLVAFLPTGETPHSPNP